MSDEKRVDVLAVLADIWHRGLVSENVTDFEKARAVVAELIESAGDIRLAFDGKSLPYVKGLARLHNALANLGAKP